MTVRQAMHHRAYWSALLSNFATGWSFFGLRIALVPLFVVEVLGRSPGIAGAALAVFAIGNASAVFPSGYLSDRVGRRILLIIGLSVAGLATAILGAASSLALLLAGAFIAGAASGIYSAPQQAAVADIIGSKARAGPAVATFQMMSDLGAIVGSFAVGLIAQQVSYLWSFVVTGGILLIAAIAWSLAPETHPRPSVEHTPARALGPGVGGEVP